MKQICVITGGGSGMGLECAKLVGRQQHILLVGRTVSKLQNALDTLHALGIQAEAYPCDTGDRSSVDKLAAYAAEQGCVKTVIHAAGVSPHMTNPMSIFKINAVGTINVDQAFGAVMGEGSCILNVASMSGYMLPEANVPRQIYALALTDTAAFEGAAAQMLEQVPENTRTGMAYTVSKNFVSWYTAKLAIPLGKKGIRVVSISPGTFSTPMGDMEGEEAASFALAGALGRVGRPEEIARMMAFMVSDECSYLTGVDILYDGGAVTAFKDKMEK